LIDTIDTALQESGVSTNYFTIVENKLNANYVIDITDFQNVGPTVHGPEQASGNIQQAASNYGAASAAAQEVLAASARQQTAAACGNSSYNHFSIEDEFSNKRVPVQTALTAKPMYANRVG